ncbi:MAG TPA: acyl carrier protein [Steroidobacteraceae bacterium]
MSDPLTDRVLKVLVSVAPDVDPRAVAIDANLRDQFDFDSMDTLHFAVGLKRELGVDIPDADFRELASIARCVRYLQQRLATTG